MAVFARHESLGVEAAFDHIGRSPLAGDHGVVAEVPPEVVGQVLRSPVDLPGSQGVEALVVHDEDAPRAAAIGSAQRTHVEALRTAVDGVGTAVARAVVQLLWLYHLDDARPSRVGLGVDDVDARRADAGYDQVPPLDVRVRSVGAQRRTARVPAEVVQLIPGVWQVHTPDDLAVGLRIRIDIEDSKRVRASVTVAVQGRIGVQECHVGELLRWRLHGHLGRGVETGVRSPGYHGRFLL